RPLRIELQHAALGRDIGLELADHFPPAAGADEPAEKAPPGLNDLYCLVPVPVHRRLRVVAIKTNRFVTFIAQKLLPQTVDLLLREPRARRRREQEEDTHEHKQVAPEHLLSSSCSSSSSAPLRPARVQP